MVLFYTIGLALSVAHCVIYRNLDGRIVGSSYDQEQNLRYLNGPLLLYVGRKISRAREDMAPHRPSS